MKDLAELEQSISALLDTPPYSLPPGERHEALLALFKRELDYACTRSRRFHNYVRHWPVCFQSADTIASLPYLPVGALKADPPLSLAATSQVTRTLASSATTGQQPSQVVLDAPTSRRMTKSITAIIRDFIGPARRPYLVIDTQENLRGRPKLGARGAAIQALIPFATEIAWCLRSDSEGATSLDVETLQACADKWQKTKALVYGFTHVIWTHLVTPLQRKGIKLAMPDIHVLHSGGWKRLEGQSVSREVFARGVSSVFGCSTDRVIDYYGMVENVGVIYPDCEFGHKHVPAFAEVIIRDPLTLAPAAAGQLGLIQVCSVLPTSFPGFLLLTEDMAELVGHDGCGCGRRGTYFRNLQRVPRSELRGCGNLDTARHLDRQAAEPYV